MSERYYAVYDMVILGEGAEQRVRDYNEANPFRYTMAGLLKEASRMEEPASVIVVTVVE